MHNVILGMCYLLEYSIDARGFQQKHSSEPIQNYSSASKGFYSEGFSELRDYMVHIDEYGSISFLKGTKLC